MRFVHTLDAIQDTHRPTHIFSTYRSSPIAPAYTTYSQAFGIVIR